MAAKEKTRRPSGHFVDVGAIVELTSLVEDPANARKHGARNRDVILASLRTFGQQTPIVVKKGVVKKGNGTFRAARDLGGVRIGTCKPKCETWNCSKHFLKGFIWVVETELEGEELEAYSVADNRSSDLAAWDDPVLFEKLQRFQGDPDLAEASGFTHADLDRIMKSIEPVAPESFERVGKNLTDHRCPKCRYEWNGSCKP